MAGTKKRRPDCTKATYAATTTVGVTLGLISADNGALLLLGSHVKVCYDQYKSFKNEVQVINHLWD